VRRHNLGKAAQARLEVMQKRSLNGIRALLDNETMSQGDKLEQAYCHALIGMRALTDDWYGRIFKLARAKQICGELTPEYAILPDAGIEHMLRLKPDLKIIFLMRDPIDRAWSSLRMSQRAGAFKNVRSHIERQSFLGMSDYMSTIERYRRFVPPENLLLLYFDDVKARPREVLERVCGFLGISFAEGNFSNIEAAVQKGHEAELSPDAYAELKDALAPIYERLLELENPIVKEWYRKHFGVPSTKAHPATDLALADPGA